MIGRPFKQGTSGNPGGRPRENAAFSQLCRTQSESALQVVTQILKSEKARQSDRIRAAELILAYAFGRPAQTLEHSGLGSAKASPVVNIILGDRKTLRSLPSGKVEIGESSMPPRKEIVYTSVSTHEER